MPRQAQPTPRGYAVHQVVAAPASLKGANSAVALPLCERPTAQIEFPVRAQGRVRQQVLSDEHDRQVGQHAPARNAAFWTDKPGYNAEHDERPHAALRAICWQVLDLWACQLNNPAVLLEQLGQFLAVHRSEP